MALFIEQNPFTKNDLKEYHNCPLSALLRDFNHYTWLYHHSEYVRNKRDFWEPDHDKAYKKWVSNMEKMLAVNK